ncbi:Schwann cell myelin protein-like isoform X2 [Engraulis encrasicolus]|uniref:Schwann cell myelin protein-like isoform X2 n=1 Tax=Engraulis encrasicolus TaxID=184585 RepID=UPI002FD3102C
MKCTMLNLIIHLICFQAYRSVEGTDDWWAKSPASVTALKTSCVVLPCTYNYPVSGITEWLGIWFNGDTSTDAVRVYDHDASRVVNRYYSRVSLVGKLNEKNCSLKMTGITDGDGGSYWFRIEMGEHKYSFINYKVVLSVKDEADRPSLSGVEQEVRSGDSMTASCSVSHSCPPHPPTFTWNIDGTVTSQSEELSDGQHKLTSSLTFVAAANQNQQPITCSAQHHGGKTVSSSHVLRVRHAPINVTIDPWEPAVLENSSVTLSCSAVGNPAISSYRWGNQSGSLPPTQGAALTLPKVTRGMRTISCVAVNSEGEATSRAMSINVEYPPKVSEESLCSASSSGTRCNCTVVSNPPSTVKWVWEHDNKESPRIQSGAVTMAIDLLPAGVREVGCLAKNKHGETLKMLHVKNDLQSVYISVGVAGLLVLMAIITLTVIGLRKRSRKQQQQQQQQHQQNKEMGNPVYYERKHPGGKTHSEAKEEDLNLHQQKDQDVYGNDAMTQKDQDVYGNDDVTQVEGEGDDIYANTSYGCDDAEAPDDIYANY